MTQQRDAKKDLEFLDKSCVTAVFSISEYWIKEAEAQRIRADKAEQEAKHQEKRALRYSNDYHEACRYQLKYGRQAELVEEERDKLINLLEKIETALEYHEWTDYMQYVSDEITAYREGSNTDAKRD